MTAETLRRAAALMRERAEGSTAGPWIAAEQTHGEWFGIQSQWTALGTAYERVEAQHIASWHPAVALAVADWLLDASYEASGDDGWTHPEALAVAQAYLGENQSFRPESGDA